MESQIDHGLALEALMMQLSEGADDWILSEPVSRFSDPKEQAKPAIEMPVTLKPQAQAAPKSVQVDTDFETCSDISAVMDKLKAVLPPALLRNAMNDLEILGNDDADIAVIIDPPQIAADQQGDLTSDPAIQLLLKSFAAIDLALDAEGGKEPRAGIAVLPISPWRIAQDRKLMDAEAEIFRLAMMKRLQLRNFRAIILAGNNVASIDRHLKGDQFAGLDVYSVVSPVMMLREPLLKRRHWQMLLAIHKQLDEILKI